MNDSNTEDVNDSRPSKPMCICDRSFIVIGVSIVPVKIGAAADVKSGAEVDMTSAKDEPAPPRAPDGIIDVYFFLLLMIGSRIIDYKGGTRGVGALTLVKAVASLDPVIVSFSVSALVERKVEMMLISS